MNGATPLVNTAMDEAPGESQATRAMRARVRGTNINERTLLATDYLNHFNEVVMLVDMIPDMPEMLEEAQAWQPRSYQDHFRRSTFSDRDLAVEAYEHVDRRFRGPFEMTIAQIDRLIPQALQQAESDLMRGLEGEALRRGLAPYRNLVLRLLEVAGGIIHGAERVMDQEEIDALLATVDADAAPDTPRGASQADIDALFG